MVTAAAAAAAFSPSEATFPLSEHAQSSRLRQVLSEFGSTCEFRDAVASLAALGLGASFKTIERVSEEVGAVVSAERLKQAAGASAEELAPENPAELLVVQGDGMRVRLREEAAASREDEDLTVTEQTLNWRECKVGVVARCLRGRMLADGRYQEPETLVQSHVATLEDIVCFGKLLRSEAERRGWGVAKEVAALSDAGHGLPGMWAREFPGLRWIVDFQHAKSRLSECAAVVHPPGEGFTKLYRHWEGLLYNGRMDILLREMAARAEEHAGRPEKAADLAEASPGRVLWTHIFYMETYRDHMHYPAYRALGWPIASGHVEAACKRVGVRMKAANKRWTRYGAGAIAHLIAERACSDGRWLKRWPQPIYAAQEVQSN